MAGENNFDSIIVRESATLGDNKLDFKSQSVELNTSLPYAKITWVGDAGIASYNKGTITIRYNEGKLASAKTDGNVCIVKDSNGVFYIKKISSEASLQLNLDYSYQNTPSLTAVANTETTEIDVCHPNTLYDVDGIDVLDVKSKTITANEIVSTQGDISRLESDELIVKKNLTLSDDTSEGGLASINSGMFRLNKTISIPRVSEVDGRSEINFKFNSGILVGTILDGNESLAEFTIIKSTVKVETDTKHDSNIIFSFSQKATGYLICVKEAFEGLSIVTSLGGKTLSFGIVTSDPVKPSVSTIAGLPQPNIDSDLIYEINERLQHTVIFGNPAQCGLEVLGKVSVKDVEISGKTNITSDALIDGHLDVKKGMTVTGSIGTILNSTDVDGGLSVRGSTTLKKDVSITGNLTIEGDILQKGDRKKVNVEQVYSENDTIVLRDKNETALGEKEVTGIISKKYDGTNDGGLVFDNKGIARIGDVTITNEDNLDSIDVSQTQIIATREDNPVNNNIVSWDDNKKVFKTPSETENIKIGSKTIATKEGVAEELNKVIEGNDQFLVKKVAKDAVMDMGDGTTKKLINDLDFGTLKEGTIIELPEPLEDTADNKVVNAKFVRSQLKTSMKFRGKVENKETLDSLTTGVQEGYTYFVESEGIPYVWADVGGVQAFYPLVESNKLSVKNSENLGGQPSTYYSTQKKQEQLEGTLTSIQEGTTPVGKVVDGVTNSSGEIMATVKGQADTPMRQTINTVDRYTDDKCIEYVTRNKSVLWSIKDIAGEFNSSLLVGDWVTLKLISATGKTYIGLQQVSKTIYNNENIITQVYLTPRSYYIENALPVGNKVGVVGNLNDNFRNDKSASIDFVNKSTSERPSGTTEGFAININGHSEQSAQLFIANAFNKIFLRTKCGGINEWKQLATTDGTVKQPIELTNEDLHNLEAGEYYIPWNVWTDLKNTPPLKRFAEGGSPHMSAGFLTVEKQYSFTLLTYRETVAANSPDGGQVRDGNIYTQIYDRYWGKWSPWSSNKTFAYTESTQTLEIFDK